MNKSVFFKLVTAVIISFGAVTSGMAANADFQDFFFDVCQDGGAQGTLNSRCGETAGGAGNLSGDSESSLNPTQSLSSNDPSLAVTRKQATENRERSEQLTNAEIQMTEADSSTGPFSLLFNGQYLDFDRDEPTQDGLERSFDGDGWGLDLGFDYRFSDSFVGGAILGYFDTDSTFARENNGVNFTAASNAGTMDSDGYSLTLFGSLGLGERGYLDFSGGYGTVDYLFDRNSVFQESGRAVPQTNVVTHARTDGDRYWGSLSGGYIFGSGAFSIGPYAGLIYAKNNIDGYTEWDLSGSGLNMTIGDIDLESFIGQLGFTTSYAISTTRGVVVPQLRLEYDYQFKDDAPDAVSTYVLDSNQTAYGLAGFKRDQSFYDLGLSLVWVAPNGWSTFIDFSTWLDYDNLDLSTITAGLRKEF